jgi:hypothetical protein
MLASQGRTASKYRGEPHKMLHRFFRSLLSRLGLRKRRRDATVIRFLPNQKI